jgi:hypothetical protein
MVLKENEDAYVGLAVSEGNPHVPCLKGKCKSCGREVYYSKYVYGNDEKIRKIIDSGNLLCGGCARRVLMKKDTKVAISDFSIAEAVSYFTQRRPDPRDAYSR